MKASIDRLVHSPFFIIFLTAIPVVIAFTVFGLIRGKVVIESVSVELEPTDMKGANWDPKGNLPDILIELDWKGGDYTCTRGQDALMHTCRIEEEVPASTKLEIDVSDGDALMNDHAGKLTIELKNERSIATRDHVDRIKHLEVHLRGGASVEQRYGTRLAAIGIGALVALLAWLIFLRGWLGGDKSDERRTRSSAVGAAEVSDKPVLANDSVRWITLIAGTLALVGIGFGIAAVFSPETTVPYLAESPCGIGAAVVGLVWLHGHAHGKYTTMDGVLIFLGMSAILMPIMVTAAAIVGALMFLYIIGLGIFD